MKDLDARILEDMLDNVNTNDDVIATIRSTRSGHSSSRSSTGGDKR